MSVGGLHVLADCPRPAHGHLRHRRQKQEVADSIAAMATSRGSSSSCEFFLLCFFFVLVCTSTIHGTLLYSMSMS